MQNNALKKRTKDFDFISLLEIEIEAFKIFLCYTYFSFKNGKILIRQMLLFILIFLP